MRSKRCVPGPLALLCLTAATFASENTPTVRPAVDPAAAMIAAERAFARTARDTSLKAAFVDNLAADSVVFGSTGPESGRESFGKRPESKALLIWEPAFAGIAMSGDMGFTTGPWEYREKGPGGEPDAQGQFSSVWRRDADGRWRVIVDIGISQNAHGPWPEGVQWVPAAGACRQGAAQKKDAQRARKSLVKADADLVKDVAKSGWAAAWKRVAQDDVRLLRQGEPVMSGTVAAQWFATAKPDPVGVAGTVVVATSGDLGYTIFSTKTFDLARMWTRDGRCEWRIALDVLRPRPVAAPAKD